jgi:hypothetical protein
MIVTVIHVMEKKRYVGAKDINIVADCLPAQTGLAAEKGRRKKEVNS